MENDENQNCEFCQESFGGLNELAKHLVYDHANYSSEDIKPSNKHQNHIKAHKCDECGIHSFNARALKIHVKNCEKSFSKLHHYHIKGIHKNEVKVKCDYSKKFFTASDPLKDHINNVHAKSKSIYVMIVGKRIPQNENYECISIMVVPFVSP